MKVVAIDLDGTLAYYDSFRGEEVIGKPITKMMSFVKNLIEHGDKVVIFSARAGTAKGKKAIEHWLEQNGLPALEVTDKKSHKFAEIYDDRAHNVERNTGVITDKK